MGGYLISWDKNGFSYADLGTEEGLRRFSGKAVCLLGHYFNTIESQTKGLKNSVKDVKSFKTKKKFRHYQAILDVNEETVSHFKKVVETYVNLKESAGPIRDVLLKNAKELGVMFFSGDLKTLEDILEGFEKNLSIPLKFV